MVVRIFLLFIVFLITDCELGIPPIPAKNDSLADWRNLPVGTFVSSEEDLKKIDTSDAARKESYTLNQDITLDASWEALCTADNPFRGTFNGAGHTITFTDAKGGLFAFTQNAVIGNVRITGTINAGPGDDKTTIAGGIAGQATHTTIGGCSAENINITAAGHGYNSSAGGIAGTLLDRSAVIRCFADGTVTLNITGGTDIMSFAGGIAGYGGTGGAEGEGSSGCVIDMSKWNGTVTANGPYPYAGGICGYNYTGAKITRCASAGTVTATGGSLPYAGGIAGYNSRNARTGVTQRALIEDCYSTSAVSAVSSGKTALAGGIAGANAAGALISRCYATGEVSAAVSSPGGDAAGLGIPAAANAGGIAGAQYFTGADGIKARIQNCAALNSGLTGTDTGSGAAFNLRRIAGAGTEDTHEWIENIANSAMSFSPNRAAENDAGKQDGANASARPVQSAFIALGWNFATVWKWDNDYPKLVWESY